jgi:uncharacterized membrane protein YgcG
VGVQAPRDPAPLRVLGDVALPWWVHRVVHRRRPRGQWHCPPPCSGCMLVSASSTRAPACVGVVGNCCPRCTKPRLTCRTPLFVSASSTRAPACAGWRFVAMAAFAAHNPASSPPPPRLPFRRTPPMIMAGGSGASPSRTPSRIGSAAPRLAGSGPSSAATLPQAVIIPTGHPSAHRDPSSGKGRGHAAPNGGSERRADGGGGGGGGRGAGAGRRPELLPYTTAACAPGPIGGGAAWA